MGQGQGDTKNDALRKNPTHASFTNVHILWRHNVPRSHKNSDSDGAGDQAKEHAATSGASVLAPVAETNSCGVRAVMQLWQDQVGRRVFFVLDKDDGISSLVDAHPVPPDPSLRRRVAPSDRQAHYESPRAHHTSALTALKLPNRNNHAVPSLGVFAAIPPSAPSLESITNLTVSVSSTVPFPATTVAPTLDAPRPLPLDPLPRSVLWRRKTFALGRRSPRRLASRCPHLTDLDARGTGGYSPADIDRFMTRLPYLTTLSIEPSGDVAAAAWAADAIADRAWWRRVETMLLAPNREIGFFNRAEDLVAIVSRLSGVRRLTVVSTRTALGLSPRLSFAPRRRMWLKPGATRGADGDALRDV
ncbi:hypothetical protein DFJ73DRAFT_798838 [Zopfochytrium polystomum]|nr:hypothetical protein DFJ73DRAFT_798838 [Zopfochytrium polystomum]